MSLHPLGRSSPDRLPPISNFPEQSAPFVGRDEEIAGIHDLLEKHPTVLLHDPPEQRYGFGKSQTAIDYWYRYTRRYQVAWWFKCDEESDEARLEGHLADQLAELERASAAMRPMNAPIEPDKNWLLVYDGVFDPAMVRRHILPGAGRVLVTSRRSDESWAPGRVQIGPLSEWYSRELLSQTVDLEQHQATHLAALMHGHPGQLLAVADMLNRERFDFDFAACLELATAMRIDVRYSPEPDPAPPGDTLPLNRSEKSTLINTLVGSTVCANPVAYDVWIEAIRQEIRPVELDVVFEGDVRVRVMSLVTFALGRDKPDVLLALANCLADLSANQNEPSSHAFKVSRLVNKAATQWVTP